MTEQTGRGGNQVRPPSYFGFVSALLALAGAGGVAVAMTYKHIPWLGDLGGIGHCVLEVNALLVAVFGAIQVTRYTTPGEGRTLLIFGDRVLLVLGGGFSLLNVLFIAGWFLPHRPDPVEERFLQSVCAVDMRRLGNALATYGRKHGGRYPAPDGWCDLLMADANTPSAEAVRYLRGRDRRCGYAVNPLADPCSAPDVVLLFECRTGWNRFGGREILSTKHHERRGSNVLFVNGQVKFVAAKDVPLLRWEGKADSKGQEAAPEHPSQPQCP